MFGNIETWTQFSSGFIDKISFFSSLFGFSKTPWYQTTAGISCKFWSSSKIVQHFFKQKTLKNGKMGIKLTYLIFFFSKTLTFCSNQWTDHWKSISFESEWHFLTYYWKQALLLKVSQILPPATLLFVVLNCSASPISSDGIKMWPIFLLLCA